MESNSNLDLFGGLNEQPENILPEDGVVTYCRQLISFEKADLYYNRLLHNVAWKNDEFNLFGKKIITKRKVAWYADKPAEYTYSNSTKRALPWIKDLSELKAITEKKTGESFNACLLNLYHDGSEGMTWHSDAESELKQNGAIGSLSFGAERKFSFKHKNTKQTISLTLHHGSLLVMKSNTQTHWLHRLPPTKKVSTPRINLTFRTVVQ